MDLASNDTIDLTLWLVGTDKEDASERFPFDSYESAKSYADDNDGMKIWAATARLDFSTMELEA